MTKLLIYIIGLICILTFAVATKVSEQSSFINHPVPAFCTVCQELVCDQSVDTCITMGLSKVVHGKSRTQRPTIVRMTNTLYNEFLEPKPRDFYRIGILTVTGVNREFWFINRYHSKDKRYNIHVTVISPKEKL